LNEAGGAYSQIIFGSQDSTGGRTLVFAPGYIVIGDLIPTAPNSLFEVNIIYNGLGRRTVRITDLT